MHFAKVVFAEYDDEDCEKDADKSASIQLLLDHAEYVRLSLRLLRDLRALNTRRFVQLNVLVEEVMEQGERWGRSIVVGRDR
jgi:hypothetical protein